MSVSLSADDRFAILDLLGRYSRALDTGDYEAYAALFTPDAELGMREQRVHGRDAIRDYVRELTSRPQWRGYQHHNSQVLFEEGDGSRCRVSCYSTIVYRYRDGHVRPMLQGIYRDVCVKLDGLWYFAERRWEPWDADRVEEYQPQPR